MRYRISATIVVLATFLDDIPDPAIKNDAMAGTKIAKLLA